MNEITINGDTYVLNLSKIMSFIDYTPTKEIKEKEITDVYEYNEEKGKVELATKANKEITTVRDSNMDNLRYDLIKTLIMMVCSFEAYNVSDLTIGNKIVLNTLINEKFLIKLDYNGE